MKIMNTKHSTVCSPSEARSVKALATAVLGCLLAIPAYAKELPASRVERLTPERIRITSPQSASSRGAAGNLTGQIVAFDRVYDLDLQPANILAPGCMVEDSTVKPPRTYPCVSRTYMGPLGGSEDSRIRVSVRDDGYEVLIVTPQDSYIIEPERLYDSTALPGAHVAYRASDFSQKYRAERAKKCGSADLSPAAEEQAEADLAADGDAGFIAAPGVTANVSYGSTRRFPVMWTQAIADQAYINAAGGNTNAFAEIEAAYADAKYIYNNRYNLFVVLAGIKLGLDGTPITENTPVIAQAVQTQLVAYRQTLPNPSNPFFGTTQLFTTRALVTQGGDPIKGFGAQRTLCGTQSVSALRRMDPLSRMYDSAHELGHNMNSCHIGEASGGICSNPSSACTSPVVDDRATLMESVLDNVMKPYFDRYCNPPRVQSYTLGFVGGVGGPQSACMNSGACGDLNLDNQILATDAQIALNMSVGNVLMNPLADVVRDGLVLAGDALFILNTSVSAEPFIGDCGTISNLF